MGAPSFAHLAKGGYRTASSLGFCVRRSRHSIPKRNLSPSHIHLHASWFVQQVEPIAAPPPPLRRFHQSTLHRIAMHVPQFLNALFRSPDVEVVETRPPERPPSFFLKQFPLARITRFSPRQQCARCTLLQAGSIKACDRAFGTITGTRNLYGAKCGCTLS